MKEAALADYIDDNDWTRFTPEHISVGRRDRAMAEFDDMGRSSRDEQSAAEERASNVFDVIRIRGTDLGAQYPFEIEDAEVRTSEYDPSPYLILLATTVAHSYEIEDGPDPTTVIQATVSRALRSAGLQAVNFGRAADDADDFESALEQAAASVNLNAFPDEATTLTQAVDEGVDTIADLWLGNSRVGRWVFLGQVTCTASSRWMKKMGEVRKKTWARLLGLHVRPHHFLAVPHHVQEQYHLKLVQDREGVVLDRLRLTHLLEDTDAEEQAILGAVRSQAVLS